MYEYTLQANHVISIIGVGKTATISEAKQYYPHFNIFIRLVTQLAFN